MEFIIREKRLEAATKETYTYGDYLLWLEEERWELIDTIDMIAAIMDGMKDETHGD